MGQRFFIVKDFERLQYRVDKALPWVKLHTSLLDDPNFERLPDAAKWAYIGLLLLARKSDRFDHAIPFDAGYIARKLSLSEPLDLDFLIQEGFILPVKRQRKAKKPNDESSAQSADSERPRGRTPDALDREGDGDKREKENVPFEFPKNGNSQGAARAGDLSFSDSELNRYLDLCEQAGEEVGDRAVLKTWLKENLTPDLSVRIEEWLQRDLAQP